MQFTTLFSVAVASVAPFMAHAQVRGGEDRRLSNEFIAGYEPRYTMTDHNAIDLDQQDIETQIKLKTDASFAAAKKIYEFGGNSKSYATITLTDALTASVSKGTALSVGAITGTAYATADSGSKTVKFQYAISEEQTEHVKCKIGGLPVDKQVDTGCLPSTGDLIITGSTPLPYTDAPKNVNGRTLKKFSTSAEEKMGTCEKCPYSEYKKFYDYYGEYDYADRWVTAAFDGSIAKFSGRAPDVDFAEYGLTGRGECAKKGTAYMNNYMYVIREFEDAIDDCYKGCATCNKDRVNAWDEGVAFYTGSLEGTSYDSVGSGKLLHGLADKRCANFVTCGVDGDKAEGNSQVNFNLFAMFALGQTQLVQESCAAAEITKNKIVQKMAIPLVQGTLRYAYKVDKLGGQEKEKAEGAVFAAAVLPMVNAWSQADADTIANNMKVGASSTVFADVKKAFENNYERMGITCDDIGQLTSAGVVYEGAEKCVDSSSSSSSSTKSSNGLAIGLGITAGVVGIAAVGTIMFMAQREKSGNPVFKGVEKGSLS